MRQRLTVFFRLIIFWMTFMIVARILFLSYNHDLTADLTWKEITLTLLYGLRMDASISGYFVAFAGLLLTISAFAPGRWMSYALNISTIAIMILSGLIVVADMELYRHWGFRMNNTPLFYMGAGAAGSVDPVVVIKLVLIWIVLAACFGWAHYRYVASRVKQISGHDVKAALVMLALSGAMFIPIRGSFSVAPMNSGFVYYHKTKSYANHAGINVVWNFLYSVQKSNNENYPENFFDKQKTQQLFASLYPKSDSTTFLLNIKQPNIIVIIIESFTADVIEPLGGVKGIAPELSALCHEGILFDNFYASGDRTDKGLVAVLSGYPAQPVTSIIKYPSKNQKLPQLNLHLKRLGYKSSFIYGGDVDFANFRSYLTTGGFDHLTTMDDFPSDENVSKWGVHDHLMLAQASSELDTTQGPFVKVILTLSSHEPFDVPMTPRYINGNDEESLFLNACHYTDKSLGDFVRACKKKPLWKNTLFIITADHGHRHPRHKELKDKERFRIPMLWLGGAIQKDTIIHTLSGQTDIANTLLAQLDSESTDFTFSKNILGNHVVPFAAYFFNDGYGFLKPGTYIVYDNPGKQFLTSEGADSSALELSKAYQQYLYSDYNKK